MVDEVERALILIKVKTLDGHSYTVRVPKDITIPLLKECIAAEAHVPPELQRLIFRGKVVKDDQLLSDHNVEDGQTLHLVPRLAPPQGPATDQQSGATPDPGGVQHVAHIPGVTLQSFHVPGDGMPDLNRIVAGVLHSMNIGLAGGSVSGQGGSGDPASAGGGTSVEVRIDTIQGHPFQFQQRIPVQGQRQQAHQQGQPQAQPQPQPQPQPLQPPAQPHLDTLTTIHQYLDRYRIALATERAASTSGGEGASASTLPESSAPDTQPAGPTLPQPDSAAPSFADASDSLEGAAAQNGVPTGGVPGEGVPTFPPVVASAIELARSVREVQEIMNGGVASFLAALVNDLERESEMGTLEARRRLQTAVVQRGNLMQQLGALLLELGRSTMTTRIGLTPGEVMVPVARPLFINPQGPNPLIVQARNNVQTTFIPRRPPQPHVTSQPPAPAPNPQPANESPSGAPPPGAIPIPTGIPPGATAVANMVVDVDEFGNIQMVGAPMVGVIPAWSPQGFAQGPQRAAGQDVQVTPTAGGGSEAGGPPAGAASAPQGTDPLPGLFGPAGGLGHLMGMPSVTHITVGGPPLFGFGVGPQGAPGLMAVGQHQQHQFGLQGGLGMAGMGMPLDMGALFGNVLQGFAVPGAAAGHPEIHPFAPPPPGSQTAANAGVPPPTSAPHPPFTGPASGMGSVGNQIPLTESLAAMQGLDVNQLLAPLMRQLAGALQRSQQGPSPTTQAADPATATATASQSQDTLNASTPADAHPVSSSDTDPTNTHNEQMVAPTRTAPTVTAAAAAAEVPSDALEDAGRKEEEAGGRGSEEAPPPQPTAGSPGNGSPQPGSVPLGLGMGGLQPLPRPRRRTGTRAQTNPGPPPGNPSTPLSATSMQDMAAQVRSMLGGGQPGAMMEQLRGRGATGSPLDALLRGEGLGGLGGLGGLEGVPNQVAGGHPMAALMQSMASVMGGGGPSLGRPREENGVSGVNGGGSGGIDIGQMMSQMMPMVAGMLGGQGGVGVSAPVGGEGEEEANWQNHLSQEEMGSWTTQMAEDEAQQAAMRPQRAPSDAYLGGSSAKRQRTAVTETCERLQEGASPQEVCRGMAEAAGRGMGRGGGGPAMTSDATARLVNHVVDTPGLAEQTPMPLQPQVNQGTRGAAQPDRKSETPKRRSREEMEAEKSE